MKSPKMTTGIIIIVLILLLFVHMRFACTGIYSKALVMYSDESGGTFEKIECKYIGWKNFKFELFKKWFDTDSLL